MDERKIRPPPRKYKMAKDIQTPPRIYGYVAEFSCCANSEINRLTRFCWGNIESFFYSHTHTHTHTQSVKQILLSRLQITNMEGSETFMAQNAWFHAQVCLFGVPLFRGPNSPKTHFWDHSMQNLL